MDTNGQKLFLIKWFKMVKNSQQRPRTFNNGQYRQKRSKTVENSKNMRQGAKNVQHGAKMCGMVLKMFGMMPKLCGMVPKMCGMVLKRCSMVPKSCGKEEPLWLEVSILNNNIIISNKKLHRGNRLTKMPHTVNIRPSRMCMIYGQKRSLLSKTVKKKIKNSKKKIEKKKIVWNG